MKKNRILLTVIALILLSNKLLVSQNSEKELFTKDFFDRQEPINLILEFDIKKYEKKKDAENYMPAILTFWSDEEEIEKEVRIKARGEFRKRTCSFSPYWLNIKESDLDRTYLFNEKKVKIVSHCKESKAYERYVAKEFLAYKIYNIITDDSYRVRLARIKYVDTGRKNKTTTRLSFIIEPEELLAERLDSYPIKIDRILYSQTDSVKTVIMSIFQYMIGNADFSVAGRHNVKLLKSKNHMQPKLVAVPYDFDYSGIVNAYYAVPPEKFGTEEVTERYYRGLCRSDQLYEDVLDIFREKKTEIYSIIDSYNFIDRRIRKYVLSYLDSFYREIDRPRFIKNKIRATCSKNKND